MMGMILRGGGGPISSLLVLITFASILLGTPLVMVVLSLLRQMNKGARQVSSLGKHF